ncbi:uncharacterized protein K441DRAFT_704213 [Cenococcum geophilum 1.58]|uniref:uncharacterized protein n=1 Tax=Cenococcum geophilum 1.58 TaxID=794803 RepID=UPI00358F0711|nr:hypothetical protein K441DRAFT_704213 [Cenococcum geophilum 1.58]
MLSKFRPILKYSETASSPHLSNFISAMQHDVLNLVTLYRLTPSPLFLTHATSPVSAVHSTLGRTRDLSSSLPGATPTNPLGGGLRIVPLYLTLWMFAPNRLSLASGEKSYNTQTIALAKAIHPRFAYNRSSARPRMHWKMSMDLREPLVRSEGNLDPGYAVLAEEIGDYEKIVSTKWEGYNSSGPLDLGMPLWAARWSAESDEWAWGLQEMARRDLTQLWEEGYFDRNTKKPLAFREFGIALGMRCGGGGDDWQGRAEQLTTTWGNAVEMNAEDDLLPITETMYAAGLIPGGDFNGLLICSVWLYYINQLLYVLVSII